MAYAFAMTYDNTQFIAILKEEEKKLTQELGTVGRINPDNALDWEATAAEDAANLPEEEDRAREISDFENRSAVEFALEKRLNEVRAALKKAESGAYGMCEVCGKEIEEGRLKANAAAPTCMQHIESAL